MRIMVKTGEHGSPLRLAVLSNKQKDVQQNKSVIRYGKNRFTTTSSVPNTITRKYGNTLTRTRPNGNWTNTTNNKRKEHIL